MTSMKTIGSFDYVIAGGGTAGCVLANRLTADPSVSVLDVGGGRASTKESGSTFRSDISSASETRAPIGATASSPIPASTAAPSCYARGRVLGGCTSINAMLYMRGQARDYNEWAAAQRRSQLGLGSGAADLQEHRKPLGRRGRDSHGDKRRMAGREASGSSWEILDAFRDACRRGGHRQDRRLQPAATTRAARASRSTRRSGVRWNATKAFLRPIKDRKNLTVLTGAAGASPAHGQVRQSMVGLKAQGVEFYQGKETVFAAGALPKRILAAGAIGSPHILQFSGIGPGGAFAIARYPELLHDLPGVGGNLQDHLQLRTARSRCRTC